VPLVRLVAAVYGQRAGVPLMWLVAAVYEGHPRSLLVDSSYEPRSDKLVCQGQSSSSRSGRQGLSATRARRLTSSWRGPG